MRKIFFVLVFVFVLILLGQSVKADCYYVYPSHEAYKILDCDPEECTDKEISYCTKELPEYYDSRYFSYFKISNCQCRDKPLDMSDYESCYEFEGFPKYDKLNFYDFENTCSFSASFNCASEFCNELEGDGTCYVKSNNIPLFPDKCSPCIGREGPCSKGLSKEECENFYYVDSLDFEYAPTPYFCPFLHYGKADIQELAFRDIVSKLNLPKKVTEDYLYFRDAYGYQCIWDEDEGCVYYKHEYQGEEENGIVKEYYTYKPCNPPKTCEEICQEKFEKNGMCLETANADEGYPEALNQGPEYCEQEETSLITGQAVLETEPAQKKQCICESHKPEVKDIILYVNPEFLKKRGLMGEKGIEAGIFPDSEESMNYFDQKIYKVLGLDKIDEWPYSDKIIFYEADWKIREYDELICQANVIKKEANEKDKVNAYIFLWVDGKRKVKFTKPIACPYNKEKDSFECEKRFTLNKVIKDARGKKIACEIAPYDNAGGNFKWGVNKKSNEFIVAQYVFYAVPVNQDSYGLVSTQYDYFKKIAEIDDKTELASKLIYIKRVDVKLKKYKKNGEEKEYVPYSFQKLIKRKLKKEFDDKKDRIIGVTEIGGTLCGYAPISSSYVIISHEKGGYRVLAHELGHSYADYCDEYKEELWRNQNKEHLKRGVQGCPNPFPKCCLKNTWPGCKYNFKNAYWWEPEEIFSEIDKIWCLGMPYAKDKITRTDDKIPHGPYWSIMTCSFPPFYGEPKFANNLMPNSHYKFIYPLKSKCPLRGC